ncbi:MAG: hypothetical protein RI519_03530 [Balneolaceae bacterium]|nr:hypothetical protein [Balneolaceae bacterium]
MSKHLSYSRLHGQGQCSRSVYTFLNTFMYTLVHTLSLGMLLVALFGWNGLSAQVIAQGHGSVELKKEPHHGLHDTQDHTDPQQLSLMGPTLQHSPRMALQLEEQLGGPYRSDLDPKSSLQGLYSPGVGWASSLILPGSAQLVDQQWVRGGLYLGLEVAVWAIYASNESSARTGERAYEQYANQNWSVVKYAQWIIDYHEAHGLSNPHLSDLQAKVNGKQPAYNIDVDWNRVPIETLRNVERNTLYVYGTQRGVNNFSHVMPDYGSQQYYELVSKYYQYGPGWSDFDPSDLYLPWDGSEMSPNFYEGRDKAQAFNDQYRTASSMLSLVILNHVISAFDSFFSRRLAQSRLELDAPSTPSEVATFRLHF